VFFHHLVVDHWGLRTGRLDSVHADAVLSHDARVVVHLLITSAFAAAQPALARTYGRHGLSQLGTYVILYGLT
jgi:hypothetical protein